MVIFSFIFAQTTEQTTSVLAISIYSLEKTLHDERVALDQQRRRLMNEVAEERERITLTWAREREEIERGRQNLESRLEQLTAKYERELVQQKEELMKRHEVLLEMHELGTTEILIANLNFRLNDVAALSHVCSSDHCLIMKCMIKSS